MVIREVLASEKEKFNAVVDHPLQSWEWGEFRRATGKEIIRLGVFDQKKLVAGYQLTVHPVPKTPFCILYFPRGPMPDQRMIEALAKLGKQKKAIMVKLEPNIGGPIEQKSAFQSIKEFLLSAGARPGRPLFTPYTFQLDLTQSEEKLLARMKSKTRYNIRLSQRHQVKVEIDNSEAAYQEFTKLFFETTNRQQFYGRTPEYYQKMRELLVPAGVEHLFLAKHKDKTLAAYIFFVFKDTLYYPYGGSSREGRKMMPTYAIFWEAIKFGKKLGLKKFDMWGTPGPDPKPNHPWYGFHRFKQGFGTDLIEFVGTFDLVIDSRLYPLYRLANELRWKILRLKSRLF